MCFVNSPSTLWFLPLLRFLCCFYLSTSSVVSFTHISPPLILYVLLVLGVIVRFLNSTHTLSLGDFVQVLALVNIKILTIPKFVSAAQVYSLTISTWLYLGLLKFNMSETEHIILFIPHILCLPFTPPLDSLTYYGERHHYPLGLIN